MNNFKLHLIEILIKLTNEKKLIEKNLSEIPEENKIEIKDYGNIKDLIKEYHTLKSSNLIKRLIKPSKEELQKLIRTKLIGEYKVKLENINKQIKELEEIIANIENNEIISNIPNTNIIFKELVEYSLNNNIDPKEIINIMLNIIRKTTNNKTIDYKIKQDILSFYNEKNEIIDKTSINTLKLLYEKLFSLVFTEEERIKYSIIIEGIYIELNLSKDISKEELINRKKALKELQKYINKGKISRTIENIEEFKSILDASGLEKDIIDYFLNEMILLKKEQAKKEEEQKITETLKNYLSENELNSIIKSKEIEDNYSNEIKQLIIRLRNDVISICRYIEIIKDSLDMHETLEILSKRAELLKELVNNLTEQHQNTTKYHYLWDKEYVPYLLRTLETKDISELINIQCLFNSLNKKTIIGMPIKTINNIPIYKISNESHTLLFSRKHNKIIIIDVYLNTTFDKDSALSSGKISQLEEYFLLNHNNEIEKLNTLYEDLIKTTISHNRYETSYEYKKER